MSILVININFLDEDGPRGLIAHMQTLPRAGEVLYISDTTSTTGSEKYIVHSVQHTIMLPNCHEPHVVTVNVQTPEQVSSGIDVGPL